MVRSTADMEPDEVVDAVIDLVDSRIGRAGNT